MTRHWVLRETPSREAMNALSEIPLFIRDLVFWRGVTTNEDAVRFLGPSYEHDLHDPFLIAGMDRAVGRVTEAVERGEKIVVFADYDADGLPGGAILSDFFDRIGYPHVRVYIPHRNKEGFGLNSSAIEHLAKNGAALLITVDCGISNIEEIAYARTCGIDVVVTDHHVPKRTLPPAHVVINPNQAECTYPFPHLSGGGLAFKLVQALATQREFAAAGEGWEKWLLDLASVSTLADQVPLVGENRALVHFGLRVLRRARRPGIAALLARRNIDPQEITEEDVSFFIAPHINAASRMAEPEDAFRLLVAKSAPEAKQRAAYLSRLNEKRKNVVGVIMQEIDQLLSSRPLEPVLLVGHSAWQPSLLGLVATRVQEKYKRTVCLWGNDENGAVRGSCRSDGSVSVTALMEGVSPECFRDHGGHERSGGFALKNGDTDLLEQELRSAYQKLRVQAGRDDMVIDKRLAVRDINPLLLRRLRPLAPFGVGNPKPLFLFESVRIAGYTRFGKGRVHARFIFEDKDGNRMRALRFFEVGAWEGYEPYSGDVVDCVGSIEADRFSGGTPVVYLAGLRRAKRVL